VGRRWPRPRVTTTISVVYAGLVVVWQGLRFTPVGAWWPFELLDIFGLLLFAPLPLLLLVTLFAADRRAGLWLLVPLVVLAWEEGPLFLPRTIPRTSAPTLPPNSRPLRVMTANLLVSNEDVLAAGALVLVEQPDVVALQELSPTMAAHLAQALRSEYPYQLLEASPVPSGLGILSRHPFQAEVSGGELPRPCFCQRVVVDLGGRTVTVVNVHPWPPHFHYVRIAGLPIPTEFEPRQTTDGVQAALEGLDRRPGPLIVAGDFNVGDRQPTYRWLRRDLLDAHREAGWGLGYTFPAISFEGSPDILVVRIDYVFHDPSVRARATRTGITPGSDHHYVVADLLLP
jgi:vancomycin resistance protein VanJ